MPIKSEGGMHAVKKNGGFNVFYEKCKETRKEQHSYATYQERVSMQADIECFVCRRGFLRG